MKKTEEKSSRSAEGLYKFFIYFVLILLAVTIIVPVAWVFMASIKQNSEFYGNPWALPAGFYWQNFVNAWNGAKMGEYMLNSVLVTALALVLLLVIALPAAYCLSRSHLDTALSVTPIRSASSSWVIPRSFRRDAIIRPKVCPLMFHIPFHHGLSVTLS